MAQTGSARVALLDTVLHLNTTESTVNIASTVEVIMIKSRKIENTGMALLVRTNPCSPPHSSNPRTTYTRSQTLPVCSISIRWSCQVTCRHSRCSSHSFETIRPPSPSTSADFPQNQFPYAMDKHRQTYPDQPVIIPLHRNNQGNSFNNRLISQYAHFHSIQRHVHGIDISFVLECSTYCSFGQVGFLE